MTEVFFKLIPQILFEPIAVGALLGLFTALIFFWKKHGKFYWIVTVSIVFMLGWRLAIQIVSTRYASLLIYPAVIFCVYFCFKLEDLCKLIPKFPEKLRRIVPWLFLIGLSIASLVKTLHCNPYENYIRSNCSAAKQDAVKFARPLALADPREVRTVFLRESFCPAFPARPADAGKMIVSIPDCLTLGCDGFPEIRVFSFRFRTLHADAFR